MIKLNEKTKQLIEDVAEELDVAYEKEIINDEINEDVLLEMINDLYKKCIEQDDEIDTLKRDLWEKGYDY